MRSYKVILTIFMGLMLVVTVVFMALLFVDPSAIIILSALAGSVIIISARGLHSALGVLAGGGLTIGGIIIQAAYLPGTNTSPSEKPANDSES